MWDQSLPNWNIIPRHEAFVPFATGSLHNCITYYNSDPKAFQNFKTFSTTNFHVVSASSGFQYINLIITLLTANISAGMAMGDTVYGWPTQYIEEYLPMTSFVFSGSSIQDEYLPIYDDWRVDHHVYIEETFSLVDSMDVVKSMDEFMPITDEWEMRWTTYINEYPGVYDLVQSAYLDEALYSTQLTVLDGLDESYSTKLSIPVFEEENSTVNVNITSTYLSPVTTISAMSSGSLPSPVAFVTGYNVTIFTNPISVTSNPFSPTVIMGGSIFATNPSTAPPPDYTITSDTYFIQWLNASIGSVNSCDLLNFDLQFDRLGGTFSFSTISNPNIANGSTINLFGFNGTVTGSGPIYTNNQVGYLTRGIFGNRDMNKQLNLLAAGNQVMFAYLTNSLLSTKQIDTLGNFKGAGLAIAHLAGCNLNWNMPGGDIPLVDFTVQEGETAISALGSMAAQFGGSLFWDGGVNYRISPPNQSIGLWEVPDKYLLTGSGISATTLSDISIGTYGPGFYSVPIVTFFDPRIYGLPETTATDLFPRIQKINNTTKLFTAQDPKWITPLPMDTEEVFLQILTTDTENPSKMVTADMGNWFSIGTPRINNSNSRVQYVNTGGANGTLKLQAEIPYTDFPQEVSAVSNNNFVMSIGVSRVSQQDLFEEAVEARNNQVRNMLAKLIGSFRYVKSYEGQISSYFFGSIPLPGMYGKATACGQTVEGIIESVSFTYPGIITVNVAQYSYVNFIKNFYKLDLLTDNGIT